MRKSTGPNGPGMDMPYIIRSYDNEKAPLRRAGTGGARLNINYGSKETMEIWEVARAATAAPLYFRAIEFGKLDAEDGMRYQFSDGGFGSTNNPTLLGIRELQNLHDADNVGIVVSVGTAKAESPPGGHNFFVDTIRRLTQIATSGNTIADLLAERDNYWRFNDEEGLKVDLDEWKPNGVFTPSNDRGSITLQNIRNGLNKWLRANNRAINECAKELVRIRRARTADASRWERFATGATHFRCQHRDCKDTPFTFRHQFEQHFAEFHEEEPGSNAYRQPTYSEWTYQKRH